MLDIGRVCIKIAGRDAGNIAIVVDKPEGLFVMVDGNIRRKLCNIRHLEPQKEKLEIKAKASTETVLDAMKKAKLPIKQKTVSKKEKKKTEKPRRKRKTKPKKEEKPVKEKTKPKKEEKPVKEKKVEKK